MLTIDEIRKRLPHRYPFLMVDRVLEQVPGERAVAIKNVTINEPFFQGHYPETPIMPGVMILEAMAQVGGLAAGGADPSALPLLVGADKVKFRRMVKPGDQLKISVTILRARGPMVKAAAVAEVDGSTAAAAELSFALIQKGADDEYGSS